MPAQLSYALPTSPRLAKGFSLIELLIVITIVAILAAVALPAYQDSVRKGHRRVAQAEMMDIANRQAQYMMANRSYASKSELEAGGYAMNAKVAGMYTYDIAQSATSVPGYTITFTAQNAQTADGDLTLNNSGVKTPAGKW